jgi:mRNA-degrading endonuclease toxin of MazEF toxin-antitoxin module
MNIDFNALRIILRDPASKAKSTEDSSVCLKEFLKIEENQIAFLRSLKQDESANFLMSFQNWMLRRSITTCKDSVDIGDIFYADLGINYKPEFSYHHPVIILEKIGGMYLIVPVSTTPSNIASAFHPDDNPTGNTYLRKVYGSDAAPKTSDGFERTGAVLLNELKVVSKGRLISKKGSLSNISDPNSLFREIKQSVFKLAFPKEHIRMMKLEQQLKEECDTNATLLQKISELEDRIKKLSSQITTESELPTTE